MKHCTLLGALVRRAPRRATRLVVAAVLLASPLPLIMAAEPANAVTVDPPIDGTVLVVAPHPDDDVLMAAGITYNRPNTVIAFMTNGDSHTDENGNIPPGIAETRQGEAVTAQAILGQPESNLIFLGYPDYHLERTWNTFAPDVQPGAFGLHSETYASRGLGGTDWHDYRTGGTGQHAPYNHEAMLADVVALIDTYRPDHVFTTSPEDGTADHRTTYTVVKAAMEQVASSDPSYAALLHSTVIWQNPPDPALNERWPELYPGSGPPEPYTEPVSDAERAALGIGGSFAPDWDDREIFNVPAALMNPNPGSNPKYQAIEAHATQGGMDNYSYIARFFHSDEFFWVEQIGNPDGAGPEVVITAPADGAVFEAGIDTFTAAYSCIDAGSGMASCVGDAASGAVVEVPTPGVGLTFTVTGTDNASNVTTVTHTYDVVDTTAPEITLLGDDPLTIEAGSSFIDPGAQVTDNVDATSTITGVSNVDPSTPGAYSVTYDYTDAAGNVAQTVYRTVQVTEPSADVVAPSQVIVGPVNGGVVSAPVVLSGGASDDVGVGEVRVEIFDRVTGRWWNGSAFQTSRTFVSAVLMPTGGGGVDWSYGFDPGTPSTLPYWWTVRAIDTSGNPAVYSTSNFTVRSADVVAPSQVIVGPVNGGVVSAPVVLSGGASDDVGVGEVRVEIFDRVTGRWWNGSAFQTSRTFVSAVLMPTGGGGVDWSYGFDPGTPSTLPYWWTVRAIDTSGNPAVYSTSNFTVRSADVVAPSQVIVGPVNGGVVSAPVVLSGGASDDVGVGEVRVEIFDRVTGRWWNGSAFQTSRTFVSAVLMPTGGGGVDWSYGFDPGTPSTLPYWWTVRAIDTSGNPAVYSTSNFTVVL